MSIGSRNNDIRENVILQDFFFYKCKDWFVGNGPHRILLYSLGDKKIFLDGDYIKYSEDNGITYNTGVDVSALEVEHVRARILANGNISIIGGGRNIFYSDDNLTSITPASVLDEDGDPFVYHEPVNEDYPGEYFRSMGGFEIFQDGCVLGNYSNAGGGAAPTIIYHTLDAITWKIVYMFGQNPKFTDVGGNVGDVDGNLLGDPLNPLITRHVHCINVGYDGNIYVTMGDSSLCMHILKGVYDSDLDSWTFADLLSGNSLSNDKFRACGGYERNGYFYWGGDGSQQGIFKCAIDDLNDLGEHITLQALTDPVYEFYNIGNIIVCGLMTGPSIYISIDYGETWAEYVMEQSMILHVSGVWYQKQYKYFGSRYGYTIGSIY